VEPLCGGLAVALGLLPQQALINDINPHLINFYRWLQRGLRIDLEMRNDASLFYAHRERFNTLIRIGQTTSAEAAALFYYLNRTGFNGLCRFNRRGEFNVPFGRYHRINYTFDFTAYRDIFDSWELATGPTEALPIEPADFIYADPPYDVPFTSYAKEGFGWDDQVRLATWLARHPGPVVLSNQATPRVLDLYRDLGFDLRILQAPRRISRTGDRTPAAEVLALRNIAYPEV
jgi:DNA adenine methylase